MDSVVSRRFEVWILFFVMIWTWKYS